MGSNSTMVQTSNSAVHVRLDGPAHATAVLLLHGFASSAHWFDDVTAELSDELPVVRVDASQARSATGQPARRL